ncbi:cytochrome P450 78A3-like [Rhododendron vialii]|uniref:cytochrome P450 78A3-like n=1 Tax=Rhododendron vialii TaxID=182163 RepID=UPI00265D84CB|nr:cytochrome P450 78A3-like [Rhododendron vialii]
MTPQTDTLWVFALAFKSQPFTPLNFLCCLFLTALFFLVLSLIYWAHPGGHAWGKHRFRKGLLTMKPMGNPIPGPRGVPVIGSMYLMSGLAHHRLADAAEKCNAKRLMAFSLGETRVIVACNPDVAKEILNSPVFAYRPVKESAFGLMFNRSIGFSPYGIYWRTLRRIAATHLFSLKQIKASESQRFNIAQQMVKMLGAADAGVVRVRDVLKRASLDNMMCSVFGRSYGLGSNTPETEELMKLVDEGYDLLGILNWSDHLPWLGDFDLQKVRVRCSELVPKVNRFVGRIIAEHRERPGHGSDFVDVLISLQGPDRLSDSDMIAVLWEMIFRGSDTVAVLIEWILARIVLHPNVQSRVHDELDRVVGQSRAISENDITNLVYLPAVIKEVLRLHPPSPLLSWARLAITDTTVDGHHIPQGTTAMANIWAIMRDPNVWSDPLEFKPERFVNCSTTTGVEMEFSILGSDLRLAPFGSGSRVCPGKAMGMTTVSFWVASLLHEFDWLPLDETTGVNLTEVLKLSCEMAEPLTVKVRPRCIRTL